jgi:hypothetical protein
MMGNQGGQGGMPNQFRGGQGAPNQNFNKNAQFQMMQSLGMM